MTQTKYPEDLHVRVTKEQMDFLSRAAERGGESVAEVVRRALEIVRSDDHIFVPLTVKERLFIEGICDTVGVQPADAVKMVLLSYHTLMSSPLWKVVKPVDEILGEMRDERGRPGEGDREDQEA